jgi:hypothetical protein
MTERNVKTLTSQGRRSLKVRKHRENGAKNESKLSSTPCQTVATLADWKLTHRGRAKYQRFAVLSKAMSWSHEGSKNHSDQQRQFNGLLERRT